MSSKSHWQKVHDWARTYYGEWATKVHIITVIDQIGRWNEVGPVIHEEEVFDEEGNRLDIDPTLPVYQEYLQHEYHGPILAKLNEWGQLGYFQEIAHEQAMETLPAKDKTYDLTKVPVAKETGKKN